jgi:hypothetical protein
MTTKRELKPGQATEIKRLRQKYGYGAYRISALMGMPMWQVKNVIEGNAGKAETGGPIKLRNKERSRWRGGRKSFRQLLLEGKA